MFILDRVDQVVFVEDSLAMQVDLLQELKTMTVSLGHHLDVIAVAFNGADT